MIPFRIFYEIIKISTNQIFQFKPSFPHKNLDILKVCQQVRIIDDTIYGAWSPWTVLVLGKNIRGNHMFWNLHCDMV